MPITGEFHVSLGVTAASTICSAIFSLKGINPRSAEFVKKEAYPCLHLGILLEIDSRSTYPNPCQLTEKKRNISYVRG
jgi:hypothetical protein